MVFRLEKLSILVIIVLFIAGCGQDDYIQGDTYSQHSINFTLSPHVPSQTNVTEIELIVIIADEEPEIFRITNIGSEQHTAKTSIRVPVDTSLTLSATAYDGICPTLRGTLENLETNLEQSSPITITLNPVQTVVGIKANQEQASIGENWDVEIYIEDAPQLMAVTMELQFDEQLLSPLEASIDDFFGSDVIFIEDSSYSRREENILSLGITRPSGSGGVCGSGILFRVTFQALGSGNASVKILKNDMLTLTTPEFEQIENSHIIIEADTSIVIR